MNRILKALAAAALALAMISAMFALSASAAAEFMIQNPYGGVDWYADRPRRAQLHAHTTASDGKQTMAGALESYYAAGYDFVAVTDHGLVDRGWAKPNYRPVFGSFWNLFNRGKNGKPIVIQGLTEERLEEMAGGVGRDGRGMVRVPFGIEHNHPAPKMHVNSWFVDWGNAIPGGGRDYATAVRNVNRRGGLAQINHPGDTPYVDVPLAQVFEDEGNYYVQKVRRLLEKYPALIGIEIKEERDRKLWDILLTNLAPQGRNVFATATGDSHGEDSIDERWVWALMPECTAENLRGSLEAGAFFSAARYASHPDILAAVKQAGMDIMTTDDGREYWEADGAKAGPMVTGIAVEDGAVTIMAENHEVIQWVSGGRVIYAGETLSLPANKENLAAYVRAEIIGEGGILYAQPFLLSYEGMPAGNPVPRRFVDYDAFFGSLRMLVYPAVWALDRLWLLRWK